MVHEDCLAAARRNLQRAEHLISAELRAYPTPVSGCDVQYNYLLGQRSSIRAALSALAEPQFVATPRLQAPGDRIESR